MNRITNKNITNKMTLQTNLTLELNLVISMRSGLIKRGSLNVCVCSVSGMYQAGLFRGSAKKNDLKFQIIPICQGKSTNECKYQNIFCSQFVCMSKADVPSNLYK